MIENAQKAKSEKYLNSLVNYEGKIITVREWLNALKDAGFLPEIDTLHDTGKEEREAERLRKIINSWDFPFGNENHPLVKQYNHDKAELAKGIFKTVYVMRAEKYSYVITKTAYDYLTEN